jgi:hypothetical protein
VIYRSIKPMSSLLAVGDELDDAAIALYPNPADDHSVLSLDQKVRPYRISILDLLGRTRWSQEVAGGVSEVSLPTADLSNGIYHVFVEHASGSLVRRLTIRR